MQAPSSSLELTPTHLATQRVASLQPASGVAWMTTVIRPASHSIEPSTLAAQSAVVPTYQLFFTQQVSSHMQNGFLQNHLVLVRQSDRCCVSKFAVQNREDKAMKYISKAMSGIDL